MKKDMGGAAHVLGLAKAIMAMGLSVRLRVLIPAAENAISALSMRPLDIIETAAGIPVEVGNTDAEGRLVLADALHLATQEDNDLIVDFATDKVPPELRWGQNYQPCSPIRMNWQKHLPYMRKSP